MMSGSGGLKPRAVAGRPSVTRLTQRSWTGMRASGRPMAAVRKMLQRERRELEEVDNGRPSVTKVCTGGRSDICSRLVDSGCVGV